MYFPMGWPKYLDLQNIFSSPLYVFCNRDRSLFAILTDESISIWFVRPCVEILRYTRSNESIVEAGTNKTAEWRPDSSMVVITTSQHHLLFYNIEVDDSIKGLYEQQDSKVAGFKRESAELFVKEKIPPISIVPAFVVSLPADVTSLVCIRDELMVATRDGHIWRVQWNGQLNNDYCLNLHDIPFCLDQQQSRASTFEGTGLHVTSLEYSPLIGGFSVVLSNGQASFITAATLKFEPKQVLGILAQDVKNGTCTAVNHRYRLIAYGLKSAQGIVFSFDDLTGALQVTHRLVLSSKDFPADVVSAAGPVTNLKWTPDGGALAMTWDKGGVAIWSVFGALLVCTLGWDYGTSDIMRHILKIKSLEWGPEGYHLWTVTEKSNAAMSTSFSLGELDIHIALFQFAKSALIVNAGMTGREHVFLQAEDKLFVSAGAAVVNKKHSLFSSRRESENFDHCYAYFQDQMVVGNKQWIIIPIPYAYLGSNWPVRYTAIDSKGQNMAVAGRSGFAHYSLSQKRWKLFGNETQERDFVVMGGLLWWDDYIVLGCYNLRDLRDEIRVYPQESKLDNQFVRVLKMSTQVLQLSVLEDRLLSFCADSHLSLYHLQKKSSPTNTVLQINRILELDVTNLVFHPACVVSALLTSLCTETVRWPCKGDESILLNVCGRLLLLQQDPADRTSDVVNNNNQEIPSYSAPTVLASSVENVWVCSHSSKDTPHLTEALWISCGANGMRVWLPLFPRDGEKHRAHNFMSKRIMLPIHVYIYPLAVLFEDAVILGAENDSFLCAADSYTKQPFSIISRTSQVYLHHILRQLLRRNLGYHAWEIARSCTKLPYFPHSLELLLHEILEEEATSSEPIPDALLPRVIDFIQEFPVFLQTVVQCARKTELALWPYLFSAVGNPKNLFRACLTQGQLDTAASYLIILQNLEVPSISHQHATLLLDSSLEAGKWELANELVRFLKAIDPNDVESPPRSLGPPTKYGISHSTPPVSPTEDDLSFVLGTMSLTRGRSFSTTSQKTPATYTECISRVQPQEISRTVSDPHNIPRRRKTSEHKDKGTAEEFFIETLLTRHARKLLSAGKLKDLGYFAAYLDFHLVTFFMKERNRAAHVDDFLTALHSLHRDFQWPFPTHTLFSTQGSLLKNSGSNFSLLETNSATSQMPNDHLSAFCVNTTTIQHNSDEVRDSGYLSNPSEKIFLKDENSGCLEVLSGHTIEAHLLPKDCKDGSLLTLDLSENSSLWADDSQATIDDDGWTSVPLITELEAINEELACRGSPQAEVQLRYLLQLMLEAGCLEWSLLVSVILRDAMAVIRVVNATRQPDQSPDVSKHLREGLSSIELWAERECLGYKAFMLAVHNQARALAKINCCSSPVVLKLVDQSPIETLCDSPLYEHNQTDHRLSSSSDVPGIEGTLVLDSSCIDRSNDDLFSCDPEEKAARVEVTEERASECAVF